MTRRVLLTRDAADDLEDLYDFLVARESPERADHVLGKLESVIIGLSDSSERGSRPRELMSLGLREYRQAFFKPYRIIYTSRGSDIYVMLIADGRRDMETLLQRRLLGA